ncbi:MAG: sensor histidine kinase, partial [Bacteroidales bacterium]|nr:sensor histidine kinase [Bacteroidales bacterium]
GVQALEEKPQNSEKSFVCLGLEKSTEKEILIYVNDNGPGIAPQKLERIFEPHFTTRSTGSGLGLAICRRLAESMHGSLHVESQPGKGACFKLRLKASKEQA